MTSQLVGSDFTGAAQLPNYVNGRLLTAEDLAISQATLRARDRRLGRAAGHGIVDGLWVTSTATTLTVASGLGVAPSGDAVSVGASVTLPLTFTAPASGSSVGGTFASCTPATATGGAAIAAGCYLLTALPACQLTGRIVVAIFRRLGNGVRRLEEFRSLGLRILGLAFARESERAREVP